MIDRDTFQRVVNHASGMHDRLASAVHPCTLTCRSCGSRREPSREEVSRYFLKGWPVCCDATMALTLPEREKDAAAAAIKEAR